MRATSRTPNRRLAIEIAVWSVLILPLTIAAFLRPAEAWITLVMRMWFIVLLFRLSFLFRVTILNSLVAGVLGVLLITIAGLTGDWWIINGAAIYCVALVLRAIQIVVELQLFTRKIEPYERLLVSPKGGEYEVRGPGLVVVRPYVPFLEKAIKIDMREQPFPLTEIPVCFTQDQYQLKLEVEIFWQVERPSFHVTRVRDIQESLKRIIPGMVLEIVGQMRLEDLLSDQMLFTRNLANDLSREIQPWGICVTRVILKQILPTPEVLNYLNRARAAEQERREKETRADADKYVIESNAKAKATELREISEAAKEMDQNTLILKYLESLAKLGEGNSTKFIPLEIMDFLKSFTLPAKPPPAQSSASPAKP